jgi:hypothetical protein
VKATVHDTVIIPPRELTVEADFAKDTAAAQQKRLDEAEEARLAEIMSPHVNPVAIENFSAEKIRETRAARAATWTPITGSILRLTGRWANTSRPRRARINA